MGLVRTYVPSSELSRAETPARNVLPTRSHLQYQDGYRGEKGPGKGRRGTSARFFGLAEMKIDTQNPNGEGESEEFGFALGDSL